MQLIRINSFPHKPLIVKLDDEDIYRVQRYKWQLTGKNEDIICNTKLGTLGRFILNYIGPLTVDHKDRDIFNYQKYNLRIATHSQQQANRGPFKDRQYKGVSWHKRDKKFQAMSEKDGEIYYGGYHKTEIEAARAYDKMALELFGEFAYLNFPKG